MASEPKTPDDPDFDDNPEWTKADFARARPASEVLPSALYQALVPGRGQGAGWQTRLNADLETLIARES